MPIYLDQCYEMKNVISYRKKMTQADMNTVMAQLSNFMKDNNLHKSGYITTTTFSIETIANVQLMDIEILCPVDKICSVPDGYTFKPIFKLCNAIKARYNGKPSNMQTSVNAMSEYIKDNNLTPITSLYNVTVNEPLTPDDIDNMIVDMYIGVSENIL